MMVSGLINLGILPLLLEAMTPAYVQHDQREQGPRQSQQAQEARPRHQEEARPARPQSQPERPQAQPRPARRPEQPKPAIRPEPRRPEAPSPVQPRQRDHGSQEHPQHPSPQARQPHNQPSPKPAIRPAQQVQREYDNQHRNAWQERRAHNWQSEHRTWQDRGGYSGYRIPEARFRGFYGSGHPFRMFSFPLLVIGGFPRFQYGGLWFSVMDPWPEYWSNDWYGSDVLYIEYWGGGYYLHNRRHPMDRIAVTVIVD